MTERTLLNLISGSLWKNEQPTEIPSEVVSEAEDQAVAGLIRKTSYQQIAYYIRYTSEEKELIRLLESHGIPLVILKGAAAAVYYPVPSRRSFGDIDFLVLPERFTDATELLEENGYTRGEDNERHIAYSKGGIHFELHRRYSYEDIDVERYVLDGVEHRVTGRSDRSTRVPHAAAAGERACFVSSREATPEERIRASTGDRLDDVLPQRAERRILAEFIPPCGRGNQADHVGHHRDGALPEIPGADDRHHLVPRCR